MDSYSASALTVMINNIFGKHIPLELHTDFKSLLDIIVGINATTQKRLLIDSFVLKKLCGISEQSDIVWIFSTENSAQALTKRNATKDLKLLMENKKLCNSAEYWTNRFSA